MIFSNTNWQTPGRNEEAAADETQFASHDFDSDEDREFVDLDDESRDLDDDHVSSSQHRVAVTSYQNFSGSEEVKWITFYKLSVIIGVKLFKLVKLEKWLSFKLTSIFENKSVNMITLDQEVDILAEAMKTITDDDETNLMSDSNLSL